MKPQPSQVRPRSPHRLAEDDPATVVRARFARDLDNLTLTTSELNRVREARTRRGRLAAGTQPLCWSGHSASSTIMVHEVTREDTVRWLMQVLPKLRPTHSSRWRSTGSTRRGGTIRTTGKRSRFLWCLLTDASGSFLIFDDVAKGTYQNRGRHSVVLVRLDFGGKPHRNPDERRIGSPHLHLYQEGYGDQWAFPVPSDRFTDMADAWQTLQDFMQYCNIVGPPVVQQRLPI